MLCIPLTDCPAAMFRGEMFSGSLQTYEKNIQLKTKGKKKSQTEGQFLPLWKMYG